VVCSPSIWNRPHTAALIAWDWLGELRTYRTGLCQAVMRAQQGAQGNADELVTHPCPSRILQRARYHPRVNKILRITSAPVASTSVRGRVDQTTRLIPHAGWARSAQ